MFKVGLTGGIGSGKTLICNIFEIFGVPVFYADLEARKLMDEDPAVCRSLIHHFGKNIYIDGNLDRKRLASIVFHDKSSLKYLNSIVHPAVRKRFDHWVEEQVDYKYLIEEAAVLLESGQIKRFDLVITVSSPEELRISRVMERDQVTKDDVIQRMKNQVSEEERNNRADAVIMNDGTKLVIPQVLQIHNRIVNRES
ncbi:MAG: dephospho-CoA kinase [Bacteroidales bacterium]|nr:dephospho-CoA kinase [Bacteroidales bacterium]